MKITALFHSGLKLLDENLLFFMAAFLIIFIPLYPKLPLFDIIPGYIVRVRLEDFFVLTTIGVWLIQVWRGKVRWQTSFLWLIGAYVLVGLLSVITGVLVIHEIPPELLHIGKSMLHLFRYIEYFSLFFIMYSAIKTTKQV